MKKLPLFLVSSSKKKHDHLAFLCQQKDVELLHIVRKYLEVQSDRMRTQITHAVSQVRADPSIPRDLVICVEQTAVYLEAFGRDSSRPGPGYYFKGWWDSLGQRELNRLTEDAPGARIVSGLGLSVPGIPTLVFENSLGGWVTSKGKSNLLNQSFSWLSDDDFNMYFVPRGAHNVLNAMSMQEFLKYDFRKPNVEKMIKRVKEYEAVLDLNTRVIDEFARKLRPQRRTGTLERFAEGRE